MKRSKFFSYFAALLVCSSCGYRANQAKSDTLMVSYVEGDLTGSLTSDIIQSLNQNSTYKIVSSNASFILKAKVVQNSNSQIGYQYDRTPISGARINRIVPNEGRNTLKVEFEVIDSLSGETTYGPKIVSASADFDYVDPDSIVDISFLNSRGIRESVLSFSLGQLDSIDGASDAANMSASKILAEKLSRAL